MSTLSWQFAGAHETVDRSRKLSQGMVANLKKHILKMIPSGWGSLTPERMRQIAHEWAKKNGENTSEVEALVVRWQHMASVKFA